MLIKSRFWKLMLFGVGVFLLFPSCQLNANQPLNQREPSQGTTPSQDISLNTPSLALSTVVPTISKSIVPTMTIVRAPTLTSSLEKDIYMLNIIDTNGKCEIPCLFGIEVGNSSWQDVNKIFNPLTILNAPLKEESNYNFHYGWVPNDYEGYIIYVIMTGDATTVQSFHGYFHLFPEPGWENYILEIKERFSLPEILLLHGTPSSVYMKLPIQYEQGGGIDSSLVLVFQESGFIIQYWQSNKISSALGDHPSNLFCFNEEWLESIILTVDISIAENTQDIPVDISGQIKYGYLIDFLELTGLNLEDLYRSALLGEQELCFELINQE